MKSINTCVWVIRAGGIRTDELGILLFTLSCTCKSALSTSGAGSEAWPWEGAGGAF